MKRTLIASLLVAASFCGAAAEVNNGAFPANGPYPSFSNVNDDFSECGAMNRPINLYGSARGGGTADYLSVKTDRGWCVYSERGIANPIFSADGPSDFFGGDDGEGEGDGGEGEGGEGGEGPK